MRLDVLDIFGLQVAIREAETDAEKQKALEIAVMAILDHLTGEIRARYDDED